VTVAPVLAQLAPTASGSILGKLLIFFLKAGSLTFGSGLVIVPFPEQGLVQQFGWLNERQFLIAVAIGMISPGPVVITATFVGYLVITLISIALGHHPCHLRLPPPKAMRRWVWGDRPVSSA
jgi:chromate transporter